MSKQNTWLWNIGSVSISLVATIAATATAAIAHGANIVIKDVRAYEIEAVYDSGEPMIEAQVSVFGSENPQVPIETGITDEQGRWVWIADQPGNWTFQVRQAGHGGLANLEVFAQGEAVDLVSPDGTIANDSESSQALAAHQTRGAAASPMPRWIAIGSILWGAIGTALFFSRRSSSSPPLSET